MKKINLNESVLLDCVNGYDLGPLRNITGILANTPRILGIISINTEDLIGSSILITFTGEIVSSMIRFENLKFRILRHCDNSSSELVKSFSLGSYPIPVVSESFTFDYCDNCPCCKCIRYTLDVITGDINENPDIGKSAHLTIKNIVISAKQINNNSSTFKNKTISHNISDIYIPPINVPTSSQLYIPITIGRITINTKTLCDPEILLSFSGTVSTNSYNENLLFFRVNRTCKNITEQISGSLGSGIALSANDEFFSYQVCDCLSCLDCDCITYTIDLIPKVILESPLSIINFSISAFATEKNSSYFSCSTGNRIAFVNSSTIEEPESIIVKQIEIGNISIDVSRYYNPKILITFTGDIIALGFIYNLVTYFKIIRTCKHCSQELSNEFSALSLPDIYAISETTSESFSYQLCDEDIPCNCDCVTYKIQFFSRYPIPSSTTLLIENVVISGFLVEN